MFVCKSSWRSVAVWLCAAFVLGGCGGGGGGSGNRQLPGPEASAINAQPAYPWPNAAVTFRGRCTGTAPLTYAWSFGDGTSADAQLANSVTHTYTDSDKTFDVSLTCRDTVGASQPATLKLPIYARDLGTVGSAECRGRYPGHGWCLQFPRADGPIFRTLHAVNADTVWGIGRNGTVLRATSDGKFSSHLSGVRVFAAASADVAWAAHAGGLSFTRNGSLGEDADWQSPPPAASGEVLAPRQATILHAVNTEIVYAVDANGLWRSTDGGNTWRRMGWPASGRGPAGIFARGQTQVWVFGAAGSIEHSADGGVTWSSVSLPDAPTANLLAAGLNATRGEAWLSASDGALYYGNLNVSAGGAWQRVRDAVAAPEQQSILSISVDQSNVPWLAGFRRETATSAAQPLLLRGIRTSGSPVNFVPLAVPGSEGDVLRNIGVYSTGGAWVAGDRNLFRSSSTTAVPVFSLTGSLFSLRAVDALNEREAWAGADAGLMFRTVSGGLQWAISRVRINGKAVTTPLRSVLALDSETAWAVDGTANLYKTADAGATWQADTPASGVAPAQPLNALAQASATTVWLAGGGATVLRSADTGATWQPAACERPADANFTAAAAQSSDLAWLIGTSASAPLPDESDTPPVTFGLYKIAGGGSTCGWITLSGRSQLVAVKTIPPREVWVLGTSPTGNATLWRSVNEGATWQRWELDAIRDPQSFVVTSAGPRAWITTPSEFWKVTISGNSATAQRQADIGVDVNPAVALDRVDDNTLWAVGTAGQLWKTLTGGDFVGSQGPMAGQVSLEP
jgi:photosystem II stability/assembly factor-like uncharacterized protein